MQVRNIFRRSDSTKLGESLWAVVWSIAFTAAFLRTLHADRCFSVVVGTRAMMTLAVGGFLYLFLFFLGNNRARLILFAIVIVGYAFWPDVFRVRQAPVEAATISALQQLVTARNDYQARHPTELLPASLPLDTISGSVRSVFMFHYVPMQGEQNTHSNAFLIEATPIFRECGFTRSFTAASDGHIYFTTEPRAATPADRVLE